VTGYADAAHAEWNGFPLGCESDTPLKKSLNVLYGACRGQKHCARGLGKTVMG
jgi:hypothetical protein